MHHIPISVSQNCPVNAGGQTFLPQDVGSICVTLGPFKAAMCSQEIMVSVKCKKKTYSTHFFDKNCLLLDKR